jgi:glyoxylase-like metal-dependent hydrolase (beta-lactamase superfamily II)
MSESSLTEISNGALLFTPPPDRIAGWRRSANVILLNNSDTLYIIDSGGPSVRNQLVSIVNDLLSDNGRPVHCIHTHGHIDHMAGVRELRRNFDAEIWASEEAIPFVESQSPIYIEIEIESIIVSFRELFTVPSWFVRAAMWVGLGRTRSLSSVRPLDKTSKIGETGYHPVELPGHHHGHFGFYNEDDSIFIVGDLIDPRHKMKPILTAPSSDYEGMLTSLETVLQIAPETLIPGHGDPILGEESVQMAILKAQETMQTAHDRVIEILESGQATLPQLSKLLLRMGLGPGDVFRRMFIHSILRHLVGIGKVSRQRSSRGKTVFSV